MRDISPTPEKREIPIGSAPAENCRVREHRSSGALSIGISRNTLTAWMSYRAPVALWLPRYSSPNSLIMPSLINGGLSMPIVDSRLRDKPVPKISVEKMESECSARLSALKGSDLAFLDQRLPAYKREIINIIGTGVTENTTDSNLVPKIKNSAYG